MNLDRSQCPNLPFTCIYMFSTSTCGDLRNPIDGGGLRVFNKKENGQMSHWQKNSIAVGKNFISQKNEEAIL